MAVKKKKKKVIKRKAAKKRVIKKKAPKRKAVRKIVKRKPAKKAARRAKPKKAVKKEKKNVIGLITHYFPHVRAGVIKLKAALRVGDTIKIKGHTTDFTQVVSSMQEDRVPVNEAKKGQEIGILVESRVRRHDEVSKV
jgi:hypothetical protein